jgi:rhodanese-related sulfurtransferase
MAASEVKDIRANEAARILRQHPHAVLIDVRTTMEFEYVGHPVGALHIPWMEAPEWRVVPDFVGRVQGALRALGREGVEGTTVLTLCRSGKRSRAAAECLAGAGFRDVYNIADGFEGDRDSHKHRSSLSGWRHEDLPWEQG